jgi:hypothetical protein
MRGTRNIVVINIPWYLHREALGADAGPLGPIGKAG